MMAKTQKRKTKGQIVDAYIDAAENIKTMLFELTQYADDLYADAPEGTTVADVRKLTGIEAKLKKIHDQVIGY